MKCSLIVLTRNEARNIRRCLESCQSFVDEIVLVDDGSTDETLAIAEQFNARIFHRALNGDWGSQQNFAIEKARGDWLFFIDADEACTTALAQEIKTIVDENATGTYWVTRINHFKKQRMSHGALSPDRVARLVPREGSNVQGLVHQQICNPAPKRYLTQPMMHYTYETWAQYEAKMNKYSTIAAKKYFEEGKKSRFVFDIVMRPLFAFIKMYFLKRGFMDGVLGLAVSRQYANYTMAKYFKLYELNRDASR